VVFDLPRKLSGQIKILSPIVRDEDFFIAKFLVCQLCRIATAILGGKARELDATEQILLRQAMGGNIVRIAQI